jgi:hypothetical protein
VPMQASSTRMSASGACSQCWRASKRSKGAGLTSRARRSPGDSRCLDGRLGTCVHAFRHRPHAGAAGGSPGFVLRADPLAFSTKCNEEANFKVATTEEQAAKGHRRLHCSKQAAPQKLAVCFRGKPYRDRQRMADKAKQGILHLTTNSTAQKGTATRSTSPRSRLQLPRTRKASLLFSHCAGLTMGTIRSVD